MKRLLLGIGLLPVLAASGSAETWQATNWMAPAHILNEFPYQQFAKDVAEATDGAMEFEIYSSGALVPAPTTMQGIADGVAQLGIVYPPYTPSELPLNNTVNDLAFVAKDDLAAAFAWTELALTNEKIRAEWARNGGIFLGGYSTPFYNFICMGEIVSPKDVAGKKVRVAGTAQTEWIQSLGGVPVSVPIADVYSGLERGSIDCTLSDATNLDKGNKFWEVAKTVNVLPQGVVLGATYVFNKDFWAGLEPAQRRVLLDNIALGLARSQVAYHVGVEAALAGSAERGLKIGEPTQELQDTLAAFQAQVVEKLPAKAVAERGIEDPTDVLEEFVALEEKWRALVADVDRTDADAVAAILKANLYDKIDENTFGVE
ncbi:C4-dicarboxylate TRAP transporter substrate-binding protein [Paracoccus denitrificans]|jgi:TRAP-type C4-dicarboxylate transport system substrate-binding protein|uniref:TRAP dicarboxylate transporter-DctP subunit n=1 Tax=Paracoccus denitrificans (strain Pd 1222) TaxID=318586 RepID=A1B7W6_PARDP|nr:C4-dicarboxylate TRAP transporter substrate-binding protein [Paracoccus denitrificans]ABL71610.1 TRAP dicarboxylate transporter- DctP subunit [Paracoccus denitrificans PD1222]MBB4628776.1 TRAP-type C4-dicarboxylate transport system substrate-binding protein [Paracoccus denitrificans]MCU7429914.1 C4-dicarboxylate TRAP transporter substrate-binding protein [Paracoccus denitrificans]QAR28205.1 C4-dicarboxylate ABC transporter substrate-binding protein [Paracoccus denitrificans]UPV97938.1 C4-di